MTATFYRVVKSARPDNTDFLSQEALGIPLRDEQQRELWMGISCQATEQQARRTAKIPGMGGHIAKIELPDNSTVRWRRTGSKPGHHTLWGDPEEIVRLVVEVVAV